MLVRMSLRIEDVSDSALSIDYVGDSSREKAHAGRDSVELSQLLLRVAQKCER